MMEKGETTEKKIKNRDLPPKSSMHRPLPKSGVKITKALKLLLREKDFNSITTSEIAKTAGANEALIYRYFKDKRGLLHYVLSEYMEDFMAQMSLDLKGIKGSINKVRKLIWSTTYLYNYDRVFAKILLLEVRNFPGYFESETYQTIRGFAKMIRDVIEEGVEAGEIRNDIPVSRIRQIILGGIEHVCLPGLIFGYELDTETAAEEVSDIIIKGISVKPLVD